MTDRVRIFAQTASLSDTGRTRASNQDCYGEFSGGNQESLLVLCDGMGGHKGGEIASQLAVETICEVVKAGDGPLDELLLRAFQEAHERIRDRASENAELSGMGTTGVALLFDGSNLAWVAHVGDSRAYRLSGGQFERLTEDHSVIADQLRRGALTIEQARALPRNELLRALGASPELQVDVARHEVLPGDRFLLCSDGLWNMVSDHEMAEILERETPDDAVQLLVARANERGANDNVTVQIFVAASAPPVEKAPGRVPLVSRPARDDTTERERIVAAPRVEVLSAVQSKKAARRDRHVQIAAALAGLLTIILIFILLLVHATVERDVVQPSPSPPAVSSGP